MPYMMNQRCGMFILLKLFKNINILIVPVVLMVLILIFGFCLSYIDCGYFSFYTYGIPIMIFSTLSFSILILSYIINDLAPVGKPYYLMHLKYPSIQLLLSALFEMFWNLPIRI